MRRLRIGALAAGWLLLALTLLLFGGGGPPFVYQGF